MGHENGARIMTSQNLRAYIQWTKSPWAVDHLLYERLPMLAVRNYLSDEDDEEWPLCWTKGRPIRLGLSTCVEALKSWQAFRSVQPGIQATTRAELQACVPRIIESLQGWLRKQGIYRLQDAKGKTRAALVKKMALAVARVSSCKRAKTPNPMLGSKVLHFFFPELFPIWDTAWIKKAMRRLGLRSNGVHVAGADRHYARAADAYAAYLNLMFRDLDATPREALEKLKQTVVNFSVRANRHRAFRTIIDDNLWDLTPILFEVCLMGRGRAERVLG